MKYRSIWKYSFKSVEIDCKRSRFLTYPDPQDRIFNRVISDISVMLRETTLTFSDSIGTVSSSPVETGIVRVVSHSTTEITEITRLRKKKKKKNLPGPHTLKNFDRIFRDVFLFNPFPNEKF